MNRLATATSPYLRQHADNPIDWWPWGPQAMAEAARRELPLLISIGYSACHWCHVMAHESFSDPEVAEFVNAHFIPIKVDREENPDVDQAFMSATQALTGQGGWPMTIFATPEGHPFFAGTYFPATGRAGQPGFIQVCQVMAQAWHDRRDEVVSSGTQIAQALAQRTPAQPLRPHASALCSAVLNYVDDENGGFGAGPKFPMTPVLDALMVSGEPHQLEAVQLSIEHMVRGGIHDIVGGGFHRYAVDGKWAVPHFEKMLYDNGLLLGTLTRAWRRTGPEVGELRDHIERAIRGIVRWLGEMMIDGAFAASQDADSRNAQGELVEGEYYLWTPAQMNELFNRGDSLFAQACFHLTVKGTMDDGRSTLRLHGDPDPDRLTRILETLRQSRAQRTPPARDDKIVAAWNGMVIDGLVQAGMVFGEPEWIAMAQTAFDAVWRIHGFSTEHGFSTGSGATPSRTSLHGDAGSAPAVLEDYAALALGAARLSGATGDAGLLAKACALLDQAFELFSADDGGFYDAPASDDLFTRPVRLDDEGTPSATSIMVVALRYCGLLSGNQDYLSRAAQAEPMLWHVLSQSPLASGWGLSELAIDEQAESGLDRAQVVIVEPVEQTAGTPEIQAGDANQYDQAGGSDKHDQPAGSLLARAVWRLAPEGSALVSGPEGTEGFGGLFESRGAMDDQPTAYICRGETCLEPVTDYTKLREALWRPIVRASLPGVASGAPKLAKVAEGRPIVDWTSLPVAEYGFPGPMRDELVGAILDDVKTATTSLLVELQHDGTDPADLAYRFEVVVDSANDPVCLTRTTQVRVVPLGEVDMDHVLAEGEGDLSVASWRQNHEAFWTSEQFQESLGEPVEITDETPVVITRFRTYRPGDVVNGQLVDFSE